MEAALSTAAPPSWITRRASGVLLHLSSLPSPGGIGDLGPTAHRFVDFLADAGQSWWQMLPVGPIGAGNSPYQSASSFAGNPLFVSLGDAGEASGRVDYPAVRERKEGALRRAFQRLAGDERERFDAFRATAPEWLREYALFSAIREARGGQPWWEWPVSLRDREPATLEAIRASGFAEAIRTHEFVQFLFECQWSELAARCHARGIRLLGDLPIYVSHDSAEVWAHRELFDCSTRGQPRVVAGVPPDYFAEDGQLWGNPLYRWERMAENGFAWWIERLRAMLARFDVVRSITSSASCRYWEVPRRRARRRVTGAGCGPWRGIFRARCARRSAAPPFLAEDLGSITPAVHRSRDRWAARHAGPAVRLNGVRSAAALAALLSAPLRRLYRHARLRHARRLVPGRRRPPLRTGAGRLRSK